MAPAGQPLPRPRVPAASIASVSREAAGVCSLLPLRRSARAGAEPGRGMPARTARTRSRARLASILRPRPGRPAEACAAVGTAGHAPSPAGRRLVARTCRRVQPVTVAPGAAARRAAGLWARALAGPAPRHRQRAAGRARRAAAGHRGARRRELTALTASPRRSRPGRRSARRWSRPPAAGWALAALRRRACWGARLPGRSTRDRA